MAEIRITAMDSRDGPSIPAKLYARLKIEAAGEFRTVRSLVLTLGDDCVEVWPADLQRVTELRDSLTQVVEQLQAEEANRILKTLPLHHQQ